MMSDEEKKIERSPAGGGFSEMQSFVTVQCLNTVWINADTFASVRISNIQYSQYICLMSLWRLNQS